MHAGITAITELAVRSGLTTRLPYREIIARYLHDAGWSLGWVSALDARGRTIWIVDAHGYRKPFVVRADEMLTAFLEPTKGDKRVRAEFSLPITVCRPGVSDSILNAKCQGANSSSGRQEDSGLPRTPQCQSIRRPQMHRQDEFPTRGTFRRRLVSG